MPKENIEGFDFTKDFTEQELFELLKNEIIQMCAELYAPYRVSEDNLVCRFGGNALAYEVNGKLYSSFKWHVFVKSGAVYKDYILMITPFNCYLRKWGDETSFSDKNKKQNLTKVFRNIMKDKYGKGYTDAGKNFAKEVKDLREALEEDLYNHKKKLLNIAYNEEIENFEL